MGVKLMKRVLRKITGVCAGPAVSWVMPGLFMALLLFAGTSASAQDVTETTVTLHWTAPGDDGEDGTASVYDIRYYTSPIDAGNWDLAVQCSGEPSPQAAGSAESFTVTGLTPGTTYYLAVRSADEVPNWSELSNVISRTTLVEETAPFAVADLATGTVTSNSIALSWTAPGDDGDQGTASEYDIRYSTSNIDAGNWSSAVQCTGEPSPSVAGSAESFVVNGLDPSTTYYFALMTADEIPNWADISNVVSTATAIENTAPAEIADLTISNVTGNSITLTWTATGADGTVGTASLYDIRYATWPITDENWSAASYVVNEPLPQASGTTESFTIEGLNSSTEYYVAIKVSDEVPNWTGLSNVAHGPTLDITPPAPIMDLSATTGSDNGELILEWTASGDDGTDGTASYYVVSYSLDTITTENWELADVWVSPPVPLQAGQAQACTLITPLAGEEYYAVVQSVDEVYHLSGLSNCACGISGLNFSLDVDDEDDIMPNDFRLGQNYPNPFNPSTTIEFAIPTESQVNVSIYNVLGQLVRTLVDDSRQAGTYAVEWDGNDYSGRRAASGIYMYRIQADNFSDSRKMLMLQ
jgi:hypothetical protein